jgi:hypothetical protein
MDRIMEVAGILCVGVKETESNVVEQNIQIGLVKKGSKPEQVLIEGQVVPVVRQSGRLQDQLLKQYEIPHQGVNKKRYLEGMNLTDQNSFAILNNVEIVSLAVGMGIETSNMNFDEIDLMKDLEVARHALEVYKKEHSEP